MTQQEFTKGLICLSEFKIGLQEAAVLFAIVPGCTNSELQIMLDLPKQPIWARTNVLRRKGLIVSKYTSKGQLTHELTSRGCKLIEHVTPWTPQ